MKTGLVLEGGAMRGLYTAGVIDVLMEYNIEVDAIVGVSAGAVFGCNFKSKQPGRVLRYNTAYCRDPRFAGIRSLIRTGDLFGVDFCYREIPEKLDLFDWKTFRENPVDFYVTCTDLETGKPVFKLCNQADPIEMKWMQASASMPLVSKVVEIEGRKYLDGGIADSIPISWIREEGYDKNIVILTQPDGYVKSQNSMLPLIRRIFRKYPDFVKAMENRHTRYNETIQELQQLTQEGNTLVIAPSTDLQMKHIERDTQKIKAIYELGRSDAKERLEDIKNFIITEL